MEDDDKYVRLSVNLNADSAATLRAMSQRRKVSITELIRRAIAIYKFVSEAQENGQKVQIVDGTTIKELLVV